MLPEGDPAPGASPDRPAYVEGVHLQRTDENVREIAALAAVLGEPTGLDGLLDDLKYQARRSRLPRLQPRGGPPGSERHH